MNVWYAYAVYKITTARGVILPMVKNNFYVPNVVPSLLHCVGWDYLFPAAVHCIMSVDATLLRVSPPPSHPTATGATNITTGQRRVVVNINALLAILDANLKKSSSDRRPPPSSECTLPLAYDCFAVRTRSPRSWCKFRCRSWWLESTNDCFCQRLVVVIEFLGRQHVTHLPFFLARQSAVRRPSTMNGNNNGNENTTMESYLDMLIKEKTTLNSDIHPNTIRLLQQG